jgi:hypothetical protein
MPGGCTSIAAPSLSAMAATRRASGPIQGAANGFAPRWAQPTTRWWCSPCRGWFGTRAIRNWPLRCGWFRMRCCGLRASGWVAGERLTSDRGPDMAALLRDARLGTRVQLLGYREDVSDLMAAADIFVLPSRFEGLPMSVIEAMLTGLPVLATSVRGPAEQVVPEVTGLLVPPGDASALAAALRRLVADKALRAHMGAAGRERAVECYDEATVVARTLDLLGL